MGKLRFFVGRVVAAFWFIPALLVVGSVGLAVGLIWFEKSFGVPDALGFVYSGGESGARSLLGAVASASIGVAGTVFSITIAALSSVVSSMGPRLLHGFIHDRGIQATLGIFVATFAFSLYSLRAVSGEYVPHYNVTVVMVYAALCIGFLVFYIGHMATSISTTRVVELLSADLQAALERGTEVAAKQSSFGRAPEGFFLRGVELCAPNGGYVQRIDYAGLQRFCVAHSATLNVLVRPGDHVLVGTVVARLLRGSDGGSDVRIGDYMVIGDTRDEEQDLEFSVRQLLEVAVRALSPGTNDPFTAMDVIDRFAEALAQLNDRALPTGVYAEGDVLRMQCSVTTFEQLVDLMFDQIRHNAAGTVAVYMHLLDALRRVNAVITDPKRAAYLQHHGELVFADAMRLVEAEADKDAIERHYAALVNV